VDPALAGVEPDEEDAEQAPVMGYIPIDLGDAVPAKHKYEYLSIRVEGMRRGSRLSKGQDNGDETWSLTKADLKDLVYIPSRRGLDPHTVVFRIIGVRGGYGEAIGSVDYALSPEDVIQAVHTTRPAAQPVDSFAGMAARFQTEVDSEVARRLSMEKAAWDKELQRRLAEQSQTQGASVNGGIDPARMAELEALMADAEARVNAAEAAAQEANDAMAHAIARAEAAEAEAASIGMNEEAETLRAQLMSVRRELTSVRASMKVRSGNLEEIQKEVHDSLQDEFAHQLEELHDRYGHELERLTKLITAGGGAAEPVANNVGDVEARIAEARRQWEQDIAAKLANVEAATKKAIAQSRKAAVTEARRQWEQEFQDRLADAQANWQAARVETDPNPQQHADAEAALHQAIAARDEEWQAELDRRIAAERDAWQADEAARLAAAQADWQASQPTPADGVDEAEVARRIEAAHEEWQAAQNAFIEARDREWQAELDRRVGEEHARLTAAQAAIATAGAMDGDPEALAAMQQEWAQSQTLEIERRLLEAEEAWQAKDEERLNAAKSAWEAEQQVLIAERDEHWKLELTRQLDEAKRAWQKGIEDHTPEIEIPAIMVAENAPVGVLDSAAGQAGTPAAVQNSAADAREGSVEVAVSLGEQVILDDESVLEDELPSFFEERRPDEALAEMRPDEAHWSDRSGDGEDDVIPEWLEAWCDRLRIPAHWVPRINHFRIGAKRLGRRAYWKLRGAIESGIESRKASKQAAAARQANPALAAAGAAMPKPPGQNFRNSALYRAAKSVAGGVSKLLQAVLRLAWAVFARLFRLAVIAGVFAAIYHGYYFAKPYVYPHVKPYITAYWDPYVGPYVRVYWNPYVQPYIDTYWGGYAKPQIVSTYDRYVDPYIDGAWRTTKSVASNAWDGVKGLMPGLPPPPKVGASVSKGAAAAKDAAKAKEAGGQSKLSAVAPRVYLLPPSATLRSGPSKYASAVGTVRHGDHLQRLEQNGGWTRIRIVAAGMKEGWVHDALLGEAPPK